jgi:hypothetical protein
MRLTVSHILWHFYQSLYCFEVVFSTNTRLKVTYSVITSDALVAHEIKFEMIFNIYKNAKKNNYQ